MTRLQHGRNDASPALAAGPRGQQDLTSIRHATPSPRPEDGPSAPAYRTHADTPLGWPRVR